MPLQEAGPRLYPVLEQPLDDQRRSVLLTVAARNSNAVFNCAVGVLVSMPQECEEPPTPSLDSSIMTLRSRTELLMLPGVKLERSPTPNMTTEEYLIAKMKWRHGIDIIDPSLQCYDLDYHLKEGAGIGTLRRVNQPLIETVTVISGFVRGRPNTQLAGQRTSYRSAKDIVNKTRAVTGKDSRNRFMFRNPVTREMIFHSITEWGSIRDAAYS